MSRRNASTVLSPRPPGPDVERSTVALPPDIREAIIAATVEALLLDLQQFPDLTVASPPGTDHQPICGAEAVDKRARSR
jgi:hypothetical protein